MRKGALLRGGNREDVAGGCCAHKKVVRGEIFEGRGEGNCPLTFFIYDICGLLLLFESLMQSTLWIEELLPKSFKNNHRSYCNILLNCLIVVSDSTHSLPVPRAFAQSFIVPHSSHSIYFSFRILIIKARCASDSFSSATQHCQNLIIFDECF